MMIMNEFQEISIILHSPFYFQGKMGAPGFPGINGIPVSTLPFVFNLRYSETIDMNS